MSASGESPAPCWHDASRAPIVGAPPAPLSLLMRSFVAARTHDLSLLAGSRGPPPSNDPCFTLQSDTTSVWVQGCEYGDNSKCRSGCSGQGVCLFGACYCAGRAQRVRIAALWPLVLCMGANIAPPIQVRIIAWRTTTMASRLSQPRAGARHRLLSRACGRSQDTRLDLRMLAAPVGRVATGHPCT